MAKFSLLTLSSTCSYLTLLPKGQISFQKLTVHQVHYNYLYYRATLLLCLWFALHLPAQIPPPEITYTNSILPAALWSCPHCTKQTAHLKAVVSSSGITFWKRKEFLDKNYRTHLSIWDFFQHHSNLTTVGKRCWKLLYKAILQAQMHSFASTEAWEIGFLRHRTSIK